ncbi:hypothetical protein AB0D11_41630 [Streptomyces monashensis]
MTVRLLLSPVNSLKAVRMMRKSGWVISFDAAWRASRIAAHPDELGYRDSGHGPPAAQEALPPQVPPPHREPRQPH